MLNQIDALFKLWTDHPGAGGQLLVTHKGKVIVDRCYGYANIETQTPMTQDSIFHVASISKPITAMAILILHDQGKLSVYDDVRKYVPDLIGFSEPLTIKQMMNHVSGMRCHYGLMFLQGRGSEDCVLHSEVLRLIKRQKNLNFQPGEEFMYSNPNYALMATIVERISGMSFAQFCKKEIFEPLGMQNSFIRDNPRTIVPGKVSSYYCNGYGYTNAIVHLTMYGSTGLNTTCRDLTKFMQHYQNPTLISRKTLEEICFDVPEVKKGTTIYGGGLRFQDLLGHRVIHHGGVNGGYRTFGALFPDDDLVVTIFTNTPAIPIETAGRDVARIVLGLPPRKLKDLESYRAPAPELDNLPGMYICDTNKDYIFIDVKDGTVYCDGTPLVHKGDNIYQQGWLNISYAMGENIVCNQNNSIREYRKFEPRKISEDLAQQYIGSYYADECQALWHITCEDGMLYWNHMRHGSFPMYWMDGDSFLCGSRQIRFTRNAEGKVDGYLYTVDQIRDLPFEKVK